jgi:hypothetical protein
VVDVPEEAVHSLLDSGGRAVGVEREEPEAGVVVVTEVEVVEVEVGEDPRRGSVLGAGGVVVAVVVERAVVQLDVRAVAVVPRLPDDRVQVGHVTRVGVERDRIGAARGAVVEDPPALDLARVRVAVVTRKSCGTATSIPALRLGAVTRLTLRSWSTWACT